MNLKAKIDSGRFVVTAEIGPPIGAGAESLMKKAAHFRDIDAVNITDNQTAIVRMSSIASARILLEQGVEPVIQVTCRDRNRIAIQSDLLGAYALGIQNVLCLTGDYQTFGNHPESRGVFDLDSIQLLAAVKGMNGGRLMSGEEIKDPPRFLIGAAANPFAEPFEFRITRLGKKIKAGAGFIQTQPVFDTGHFRRWMEGVRSRGFHRKAAILAGIMPVRSARALVHMQKEVPGMRIPAALFERMEKAADPKEEGIRIAVEAIRDLRGEEGLAGFHLMPLMWESITPRLVRESGLLSR
ncbi:methylenetetrahydrofolate reductase [bacterium]|nr:methylenetetrahydrofolate reductase [bacterium]